ncbi:MAG: hypothetical protein AAGA48_13225 [Myxococcota bacterium]
MNRRLLLPLAVAVGGLVLIGAVWIGAQTRVRFALWRSVAERPLSPGEGERLGRCDRKPGWWTWVKVLHNDRPVPCGEGWAIDRMADKIQRSPDRRRWVRQYVESPDAPAVRQLRATLLLNVVGEATPEEPAWLALDPAAAITPEEGPTRPQAEGWHWAVHLGPRFVARGTLEGMTVAGFNASEAIGPYEALWALEDPSVHESLVQQVADGLQVASTISEDRWYRRRLGRPSDPSPRGWTRLLLGRAPCSSSGEVTSTGCLTLWRDLLIQQATSEANDEPWDYPDWPDTLSLVIPVLEPMGRRTRAIEWWMQAAEDWVRAAPDPDRRLISLARSTPDTTTRAHPLAVLHDRAGSPFMTAAVIAELGRRTIRPVEVRADDDGTVWLHVGNEVAARPRCGTLAPAPPQSSPWPDEAIAAAALLEAAAEVEDPLVVARYQAAAAALDAGLGPGPALPTDASEVQTAGFETGRTLFGIPPATTTPERARAGAQIGRRCDG